MAARKYANNKTMPAVASIAEYNTTPPSMTDGTAVTLQVDSSGNLKTTSAVTSGATTVTTGQVSVTNSATQFTSVTVTQFVTIKARSINTDFICIGPSGVSAANGYILNPGEQISLPVSNLNALYHISNSGTQALSYIIT